MIIRLIHLLILARDKGSRCKRRVWVSPAHLRVTGVLIIIIRRLSCFVYIFHFIVMYNNYKCKIQFIQFRHGSLNVYPFGQQSPYDCHGFMRNFFYTSILYF